MNNNEIWDFILDNGIATYEELSLVVCINGMNEESLNAVLYARTGYHTIDQIDEWQGV